MLTDRSTDFIAMYTLNKNILHLDIFVTYNSVTDDPNFYVSNTLRMEAFKLFKCMLPVFKQFQSTFILCFFKNS
jgi:hypothetical protein